MFSLLLVALSAGCGTKPIVFKTTMRVSPSAHPPQDLKEEDPEFSYLIKLKTQAFDGSINIENNADTKNGYRILCFSDYQQVECSVGGRQSLTPSITLGDGEQKILPLTARVGIGSHSFSVVALEDAPKDQLDELNAGLNDFANGNRFFLSDNSDWAGADLNRAPISPGKKPNRRLEISNSGKETVRISIDATDSRIEQMAVILLVDYHQKNSYLVEPMGRSVVFEVPKPSGTGTLLVLGFEAPLDNSVETLTKASILQSNRLNLTKR